MEGLAVIVGLGNPGRKYQATRHNAGFLAVRRLAERADIRLDSRKFTAEIGRGAIAGRKVLLALPQTFMNRSGDAVDPLLGYFRVDPADLVVIHDDVDLDFGRIKVKQGGGNGGHKGLRSIDSRLQTNEYTRVRIGVGRPEPIEMDTADWVLSRFAPAEQEALPGVMDDAARAVEAVFEEGIEAAMNRFNARP